MFKLLKYELKGNYKFFLSVLLSALVLSLLCIHCEYIEISRWVVTIINFVVGLITLMTVMKLWQNEMYEAQGYLTFTLPQKGRSILAAKIISSIMWVVLCFLFAVITEYLQADGGFLLLVYGYLVMLGIGINIMFMGYFCLSVARIDNNDKKLGKLNGFIIFILLIVFKNIVDYILLNHFSNSINLPFNGGSIYRVGVNLMSIGKTANIRLDSNGLQINVATLIFNILFLIGLFERTVHFIDKKIDL